MEKVASIVIVSIVLSMFFAFQTDAESEDTGRFAVDSLYALIEVGKTDENPPRTWIGACELTVKYHFETFPGSLNSIHIQVLGEETSQGVCISHYGSAPVEAVLTEHNRFFLTKVDYEGLDTLPVIISLYGSFYDSIEKIDHGNFKYVDTLSVPIQSVR